LPWEFSVEKQDGDRAENFGVYSDSGKKILENLAGAKKFTAWLYEKLKPYFKTGNILEIGSGNGTYSEKIIKDFSASHIFLSDLDQELLSALKNKFSNNTNISLLKLDIARRDSFNFFPSGIDTAVAINVLEHVKQDTEALKNIYDRLNAGGRFIVLVPAHKFLYNAIDKAVGHYRRYSRQELEDKARACLF
jgi:SAM-dependent methyltransferase